MKLANSLEKLFDKYDLARAKAKDAEVEKKEASDEIKATLEKEKLEIADTPSFMCVYKFEKDKEVEVFDEEKFAEKEPVKFKQYQALLEEMKKIAKKYTKKSVVKGARKLLVTRKNEGEE